MNFKLLLRSIVLSFSLVPICVQAIPVTLKATGTLFSSDSSLLAGKVPNTANFTFYYTYDNSVPDANPDPTIGEYLNLISSGSVSIGDLYYEFDQSIATSTITKINLTALDPDTVTDEYLVLASAGWGESQGLILTTARFWLLALDYPYPGPFLSDSLFELPDANLFGERMFGLHFSDLMGTEEMVFGFIHDVQLVSEPSALLLLCFGLLLFYVINHINGIKGVRVKTQNI